MTLAMLSIPGLAGAGLSMVGVVLAVLTLAKLLASLITTLPKLHLLQSSIFWIPGLAVAMVLPSIKSSLQHLTSSVELISADLLAALEGGAVFTLGELVLQAVTGAVFDRSTLTLQSSWNLRVSTLLGLWRSGHKGSNADFQR